MHFFQAIILGIVQALTEIAPVSSTAHIRLVGTLMIGTDPGSTFSAITQMGPELATILFFRRDIVNILSHWFGCLLGKDGTDITRRLGSRDKDAALGWYIIIASVPIVVFGLLFQSKIQKDWRNMWVIVAMMFIFGILLWFIDARSERIKSIDDMSVKDSVFFGIGQVLALIPGVSRTGGTITAGRAMGYTRESAARVSFLMAIPAVLGAGLLQGYKAIRGVTTSPNFDPTFQYWGWPATIVATIVCFIVSYFIIIIFLKFISKFSYKSFAVYRIGWAVLVAVLLVFGVLKP